MRYEEHIWFIFNTSAFFFREGKDVYLYFLLDNFPVLVGLPFVFFGYRNLYRNYKANKEAEKLKHV